jgi:phosphoesterase RecJ-like protein
MTIPYRETIKALFTEAQSVLLASHIRPDGDAVGSLLGLGNALILSGKKVFMALSDGLPSNFHYLHGAHLVKRVVPKGLKFDLTISLDTSDLDRSGGIFGNREIILNIDHHITNTLFAQYNLNDPESVATCALVAENLEHWGLSMNAETASLLMTGLITDTIGFRTSNMSSKAMRIAADLIDKGADLPTIYQQALTNKSFDQLIYWGYALKKLKRNDRLAWTTLTLDDRKDAGYNGNDDADLNTILSSILDCDITILFVEQNNGHVKVSWRGKSGFNVSNLAQSLGGGGHPAASGTDIEGSLEEVQFTVINKTLELMKENK